MAIESNISSQEKLVVSRLKQGDMRAFNVIFGMYSQKLYVFAYGYLKSKEDAEEIVQDAFLRLWNNKETLEPERPLNNFLFTISYRLILNRIRDNKRNTLAKEPVNSEVNAGFNATEQEYDRQELESLMQVAVAVLPPKRKVIFQMSRHQELSHQEISEKLNISKKTVEAQITEALKYLRKVLVPFSY